MINTQNTATGGFSFPIIYQKNQHHIEAQLEQGDIDYADLTRWSFPDEFLCFVLENKLFQFIDHSYPNPRSKNEVPIWFLISCQFVMRLFQTGHYHHLQFLLTSGSILSRFGFNVGAPNIGFNAKNKKERKTAVHADTVRKFFKDTSADEIRKWYINDLQSWFKQQRAFDHQGIFVLDQSHLVVPDNPHYKEAVKMPVDEHGQLYSHLSTLSEEQKRGFIYHRCYSLSTLLNVSLSCDQFHIAGYELGPGNEDELVQANRLVPAFCKKMSGVMKLLIVDRGYIDGSFINTLKNEHGVDVLIPLRKNMQNHQEAIAIVTLKNNWQVVEEQHDGYGQVLLKKEIALIEDLEQWDRVECKLHAVATRYTSWDLQKGTEVNYGVLVSTKKYHDPKLMLTHYDLRMQTEERYRQFKHSWYITDFPSPHASLIASHVCFTLLTYSLLQLYLRRKDLRDKTHKMMATLRADEQLGKDAVLVYSDDEYGVFDLDDYTFRVAGLQETPRHRLMATMQAQKEARLKRESS